jgi:hypothetical protein
MNKVVAKVRIIYVIIPFQATLLTKHYGIIPN